MKKFFNLWATCNKWLCPYCKSTLDFGSLRVCERCRTGTHIECWKSHGGCPVFGCDRREAIPDSAFSWFTLQDGIYSTAALASLGAAIVFPGTEMFYFVLFLSLLLCAGAFVSDRLSR